ncbi:transcriptional regulator [Oceanidesulfovibrio indonesiensis]|uniref:Transcriptional regulator n=1 Tax=Oceanidesulfovibrio indonesiensis TaxID=54767 RepID=A0A7M3MEX7_9BACT|nr:ATP-binding protein [Oceanidesulfovibrio indonesiensis]TVM17097.1 transcriptional regulator [Oceanidesulfovibrio indonesiensis]
MTTSTFSKMITELTRLQQETEWVEFKENRAEPEEIGEYISALSNSAALVGERAGFLVWGVENGTHRIVGTTFDPASARVGSQELESWLVNHLSPRLHFRWHSGTVEGAHVVALEVPAARGYPVRFKDFEFIRVGSYKKKLKDYPDKAKALWKIFERTSFERDIAAEGIDASEVLALLDYPAYFDAVGVPLPENREGILDKLKQERFVLTRQDGGYDITNLGAILFAKDLGKFDRLGRKALRVIFYNGPNRIETIREQTGVKGYIVGYEGAVSYINDRLPANEIIGQALRTEMRMYPEIAIRELVANALIHQDFSIPGAGPMVEIFSDRMEFTNPGQSLIDPLRLIDHRPRSRNEDLAAFMRRVNICEERGSGIDKVITAVEQHQLPPPDFRIVGDNTVAVLFAPKKLAEMDPAEKIRACYQHACLCHESNTRMTNASLRKRFGIKDKNYATASRIIGDTIKAELVRPFDPEGGSKRLASYVPFWA